ncbi:MAG: hypothetical protein KDE46_00935 [Caldilineaceae bacterium]|nr:hypothetical protein [Caldilineaceae bacterium]
MRKDVIIALIGAIATLSAALVTALIYSRSGELAAEELRQISTVQAKSIESTATAQASEMEVKIASAVRKALDSQPTVTPYPTFTSYPTYTPKPTEIITVVVTLEPSPTDTPSSEKMPDNTATPNTKPENTLDTGPRTIVVDASIRSANYENEIYLIVDEIEILSNGRMRWHISLWNKTDTNASTAFGEDRSYVTDELGTNYSILAMSPSGYLNSGLRAGVRARGTLDFNAPTPGAKEFKLYLVLYSYGSQQLWFDGPVEVFLDSPLVTE